jgi:hypothetical protein
MLGPLRARGGGGGGGGAPAPTPPPPPAAIFCVPKNSYFSGCWVEVGQIEKLGWAWGKGCLYIKDCFKPIFSHFLTSLLRKLKFLMSMVFRRRRGCLCLVSVVCVLVEVSVSGWSLVQRSPTECGVSNCDGEASIMSRLWLTRGCCTTENKKEYPWSRLPPPPPKYY